MDEQKLLKKKKALTLKGSKLQVAGVCNDLAELYSREGKFEQAINEYKDEAKMYKELDKKMLYAKTNRMIGEIYTHLTEFDKALEHENIHLEIAIQEQNNLERQRALASIGRTRLVKGISDSETNNNTNLLSLALKSFSQSLKIAESLNDINKQEQMDMRARLLLNIGLVYEHQGDYEKAIEYMNKSIQICKTYDIYEQLHLSYYSLGLLNSRKKDYDKSVENLNLAINIADRLSDKVPPLCTTLIAKADVLIKLADFNSAKHILLKGHKLKSPNIEERKTIEHNLKVVAAMCMTEDQLLTTSDTDFKKKKSLYEKMGDGACDLKNFEKGIDYYKKMLECAKANGETGKHLIPVYVSLAQTYKDHKDYGFALHYFQKDLEINRNNPEESCATLLNIAEILDLAKSPYEEIANVLRKARTQAHATGKMKIEGKVIKQFVLLKKKFAKLAEAAELEKELVMMDYQESDNDSEEDVVGTPDIGDDINISDISDLSDGSDNEKSPSQPRTTRRRSKTFGIKKNRKGETQLHTACIRGNIYLVSGLIDQGHLVNIRDNSGWLPIHEACNYGYLEIVRILLDKGANINDRGGTYCGGVTPLHDACSNGHLEVIECILNRNASPLAKTNSGETPLDMLRIWRKGEDLDAIQQTYYETIASRMISALEKAGQPIMKTYKDKEIIEPPEPVIDKSYRRRSPRVTPVKQSPAKTPSKIGSLRHTIDTADDLDKPSCSGYYKRNSFHDEVTSSFEANRKQVTRNLRLHSHDSSSSDNDDVNDRANETGAAKEYKQLIQGLRTRYPEPKANKTTSPKGKSSGFLRKEDVGDDWLEDDLETNQPTKKRKRNSNTKQSFIETSGIRRSNSFGSTRNSVDSPNKNAIETEFNDIDQENFNNTSSDNNFNVDYDSNDSLNSTNSIKRKKSQSSLLHSGFSKKRSASPLNSSNLNSSAVTCVSKITQKTYKRQQKLISFMNASNFEPDSTSQIDSSQIERTTRSFLAVNVKIDGKLWRIPIPINDIDILTIGFLAKEAARRYYKKEGIEPTLQLETKEGAILENEDPLSLLCTSPSQLDDVNSVIVSWNLPPLPERYVEACSNCKINVNRKIRDALDECQGTLKLKLANFALEKIQLPPIFRALTRQDNLQSIDLSGNPILNDGIKQLCTALPLLVQLRSLNLSLTNITGEGIRHLSNIFTNDDKLILQNLIELNLSYNLLGDESLSYLSIILQHVNLRVLNLTACDFTENIFDNISNHGITLNFDQLEVLDLSSNDLNRDSVIMFISFINFNVASYLNFSNNSAVTESGIAKEIAENLQQSEVINIKSIHLERCKVNDSEIWDLLRTLLNARDLDTINLSYNDDITSVSLRRLLHHRPSFSFIYLEGCSNIIDYLDQCISITNTANEITNEADMIISMWERQWGRKSKVEKKFNNLIHLTVGD